MYLNHIETSHVVIYRGREGGVSWQRILKGSSPNEVPFSDLRMEDSTALAILRE